MFESIKIIFNDNNCNLFFVFILSNVLLQNIHLFTIIAPLLMGFCAFILKDKCGKYTNYIFVLFLSIITIITIISIYDLNLLKGKTYYIVVGGWSKAVGIELKLTLLRIFCSISVLIVAMLFFAINLNNEIKYSMRGFACIMLCGANGMIMTNDIFNQYVFFEIVCITSYIFYSYSDNKECIKNAFNYMIVSSFTGVLFLIVAGILYQITGHLNIDLISQNIKELSHNKTLNALYVIFILGMCFKLGVYPLHNILFSIYKNLHPRYLSLVSGISAIVYPFFILKFTIMLFGEGIINNNEYLDLSLKIFGGIGFAFFSLMAFSTDYFLKFVISLAFAQTSFFAFCLPFLPDKMMIVAIVLSITSHAILKVCLLGFTKRFGEKCNLYNLKKIDLCNITNKFDKYLLTILVFLISGMPLSLVFMSKWYSLFAVINSSKSILWLIAVLIGFAIDIIACFAVIMRILTKNNQSSQSLELNKDYLLKIIFIITISLLIISTFYVGSFKLSQI